MSACAGLCTRIITGSIGFLPKKRIPSKTKHPASLPNLLKLLQIGLAHPKALTPHPCKKAGIDQMAEINYKSFGQRTHHFEGEGVFTCNEHLNTQGLLIIPSS